MCGHLVGEVYVVQLLFVGVTCTLSLMLQHIASDWKLCRSKEVGDSICVQCRKLGLFTKAIKIVETTLKPK